MAGRTTLVLASLGLLVASLLLGLVAVNPVWVAVMVSAGLVYGALAPVIAARRLYFLAGATPHAAFLVAVLGIPVARALGIDPYTAAIALGLVLVYAIGFAIHRGADPDIATSVFVAFTASATVISVYFVMTSYPLQVDLSTIVVGDPLLATPRDALASSLLAIATLLLIGLTFCEQACIGVDVDTARLAGIRIWLYDLLLFTLLAVASVALIRIVGFVLEHVLILLPASIAVTSAWSARGTFVLGVLTSTAASLIGLYTGLLLGQAPAGLAGLLLLAAYLVAVAMHKKA